MTKKKQQRVKTEPVAAESAAIVDERTERLRELVPEALTEGKIRRGEFYRHDSLAKSLRPEEHGDTLFRRP